MPVLVDRVSAFNFNSAVDDALPLVDGSIDVNDRATLLNCYAPTGDIVEVLDDTTSIEDDIIRAMSFVNLLNETINTYLIGLSDVILDHETTDFSQYTTPEMINSSIVTPGLGNTTYGLRTEAAAIIGQVKTFTAPTGTFFELRFYLNFGALTVVDSVTSVVGIRLSDGGGTNVFWTTILHSATIPTGVTINVDDDNASTSQVTELFTRADDHQIKARFYKASSATASDGRVEIFVDSSLTNTINNLDLFDQFANMSQIEVGILDNPGGTGHLLMDEIFANTQTDTGIHILVAIGVKLINETITLVEHVIQFPGVIQIIAESLQLSDIPLNVKGLTKILAETINILETALRVIPIIEVLIETVNASEANLYILGRIKILAETIQASEGLIQLLGILGIIDETTQVSEGLLRPLDLRRIIDDGLGLTVAEGLLKIATWVKIIDDTVNLTELQLGPFRAYLQTINEVLNISELANRVSGLLKVDNDTINLTEVSTPIRGYLKLITENINISEDLLRLLSYVTLINENLQIRENILDTQALVRLVTETINVLDGFLIKIIRIKLIAETIQISEIATIHHGYSRLVNESVTIVENILRHSSIFKILAETIQVSEGTLHRVDFVRLLNDHLLLNEDLIRSYGFIKLISDGTIGLSELILLKKFILKLIGESLQISEVPLNFTTLYVISKVVKRTGVIFNETVKAIKFQARRLL